MSKKKYLRYKEAARSIGGLYSIGYIRGISIFCNSNSGEDSKDTREDKDYICGLRDGLNGMPPKGFQAYLGNNNAAKPHDVVKSSNLHVRTTRSNHSTWKGKASQAGLSLTDWVTAKLNDKL